MSRVLVLDAWAIMAWLRGEPPAAGRVRSLLDLAGAGEATLVMNIVNVGEVFYKCVENRDLTYGRGVVNLLRQRVGTVPATDDLVMQAAALKAHHRISYADGFAAATAILHDAPLVTGDPELRAMAEREPRLKIDWIAE